MLFKARRSEKFKRMFIDLTKKDAPLKLRMRKKIEQILENPENHDMKTGNLRGCYGVHKDALEHSRKEYFDGVAQAMQQMAGASVGACDCDDGECDGECSSAATYVPSGTSVDGYN